MVDAEGVMAVGREVGVCLGPSEVRALTCHLEMVRGPGARLRLVADASPGILLHRHLADSLVAVPIIDDLMGDDDRTVVDVGSGGGFPGVVLAAVRPQWSVTLVESQGKRAGFLMSVAQRCRLSNITVVPERAEAGAALARFVTARAVAPLGELVPAIVPALRPGGYLVLWKGPGATGELEEAAATLRTHGLVLHARHRYRLPDESIGREITVLSSHRREENRVNCGKIDQGGGD